MDAAPVRQFLLGLQESIISRIEALDGKPFIRDEWQRPAGEGGHLRGGGITRLLEEGNVFERAGVGFSDVQGASLPSSATAARSELAGRSFQAMGVSLVFHPRSPHVPTVHLNVRFFLAEKPDAPPVWWFGGGMDLTPYYPHVEDVVHFHRTCRDALAGFDASLYPRCKKWCDEYFFLRHRNEPRGVGGLFFDDLNQPDFDTCHAIMRSVGEHFLPAYVPIVERRRDLPYTEAQRDFQQYRRGRYVEFNLVYDRGTLFGLQSGGRTESILMSMPPRVQWRYDWKPQPGTPEAKLYTDFLVARDWLAEKS